ncbi:MAG: outer membrane protein transport protein, partial [Burkholderiales bacterium]|nr:outer membrane protein transport protein [Burkholderiales bacterium]
FGEGWDGRVRGISASIITLDINPTIAWKFNKYLSIGVGASALYQHSKIKEGLPLGDLKNYGVSGEFEYKGSDWMWTWDIGLMISPLDTLRFGVSYRSAAHVRAKGDYSMRLSGNLLGVYPFSLEETTYGYGTLTTPETIYISGFWQTTPKLSLAFTARWANWKNFENMRFYARDPSGLPVFSYLGQLLGQSTTSVSITNDWRSVWFLSLGADYKFTDHWTGRAGLGYEFNPITDQKLKTALIPDTQRLWISLGASWSSGKHWQIDAAVAELIGMGHKGLYDYYGEYLGKYHRVNGTLFGAAVQYHF